jgi:LEA14-like dessication related protein
MCVACESKVGKLKKRKRKSNARVGAMSSGTKVILGVLVVGGIGAAIYFKYQNLDRKIAVETVDIDSIGLTKMNLTLHLFNFSTAPVPFNGFSGKVVMNGNIDLGNCLVKTTTTLQPSVTETLPVEVNFNLLASIDIVKGLIESIDTGDWSGYSLELMGDLFSGDFTIPISKRFL